MGDNGKISKMEAELMVLKQEIDKLDKEIEEIKKDIKTSEKEITKNLNKLFIELNKIKSEIRIYSKIPTGILIILSIINMIIAIILNIKGVMNWILID